MAVWIAIAESEEGDAEEVQSEDDGTLLLASLENLYRNVTTLKYKGPAGLYRVVRCIGGVLSPPEDSGGWGSHTYICVTRPEERRGRGGGRNLNSSYSGEEVDPEDENCSTPLMMASLSSNPHCVHELLLHGADISKRNVNSDTAYSLAVKHGARNCQTVLENHMLSVMGQPRV